MPRALEPASRPSQAPTRTEATTKAPFASVFASARDARAADARGARTADARRARASGASREDTMPEEDDAATRGTEAAEHHAGPESVAATGVAATGVAATGDLVPPATTDAAMTDGGAANVTTTSAAATNAATNAATSAATNAATLAATTAAAGAAIAADAAATRAVASAPPPAAGAIDRATSALASEFRGKLECVIDRMREELGHTVQVVETYRSQARQDALYAQGRTQPGDVVTWTRDSNHTAGLAADVTIDGGYDDAAAFVSLARIAREEGLRTLGPRDPGHIELANGAALKGSSLSGAMPPTPRPATPGGAMMAAPAPVASVARVASVASVATVANVANVANVASIATTADAATAAPVAPVAARAGSATERAPRDDMRGGIDARTANLAGAGAMADVARADRPSPRGASASTREDAERTDARDDAAADRANGRAAGTARLETDAAHAVVAADRANAPTAARDASQGGTDAIAHSDAAERIARVLKLRDDSADRTLSNLLLRIDHPDGSQDRIRVDRRGLAIGATLEMSDASSADQLRANVGELRRALERAGLETDGVSVRGMDVFTARAGLPGLAGGAAAIAAEHEAMRDALRAGAMSQQGQTPRDRHDRPNTPTRDQRAPSDSNRHRSRREQRGTA